MDALHRDRSNDGVYGWMARILLVEDEFLIRLILAEELAGAGHDVSEAATADEALTIAAAEPAFDILVTDIQTPGVLNGVTLATRMREMQPTLPVVYVTGRPEALSGIGTAGPGDAFVRKPYSAPEVVAVVASKLNASSQRPGKL